MRKILILILTVSTLFIMLGLLPVHSEAELYDNVLRLHVLANSDSDEDQALKLKVRDAIIDKCGYLFTSCQSREEAASIVEENRALLEDTAKNVIADAGYSYPVTIDLGQEDYPTKNYGAVCFPAGNYLSLKVIIGEGNGQNWWCVLFPPMCLSAATVSSYSDDAIPVCLTGEQYKMITETDDPKYTVRVKILEVFGK